jgi:hypothetical protein
MKKNFFQFTVYLMVTMALVLTSCSKTPENVKLIPENTKIVASFNLPSIAEKADLPKVTQMQIFKALQQEIKSENRQLALIFDEMREDPAATGIDLRKELIGFLYQKNEKEIYTCLTAVLSDDNKFKSLVKNIAEMTGKDIHIMLAGDVTYIQLDYKTLLAWDDDKAIIAYSADIEGYKNHKENVLELFKLEKNISSNKQFEEFMENRKDISMWFSFDIISSLPQYAQLKEQMGGDYMKGSYFNSYISFEKEKISWVFDMNYSEEYLKMYNPEKIINREFNADLLKLIPSKQLLTVSYAVNVKEYLAVMSKQKIWKNYENAFNMNTGMDLNEIVSSIKGNLILSIYDLKPAPQMALAMELNDKTVISNLLDTIPGINKNGNLYSLNAGLTNVFIVLDDNLCYITNDAELSNVISQGNFPEEVLQGTEVGKKVMQYPTYLYFNLNKNEYPADVIAMAEVNPKMALTLKIIDEYATSMEIKMLDKETAEFAINTTNQTENSLYSLIALFDKHFKQITAL